MARQHRVEHHQPRLPVGSFAELRYAAGISFRLTQLSYASLNHYLKHSRGREF